MNTLKYLALAALLTLPLSAIAQTDSLSPKPLVISAYAELFYAWDFNADRYNNTVAPNFLYNFNRHNEVNVNLAYIKAAYAAPRLRANLALMAGAYPAANLSGEPDGLRHLLEANAGVRLGRGLWLDAGILPAHIGFESAVGKDCRTLTRSLAAENSPYFETGVRLSWSNDQWTLALLYLNGWQRIARQTTAPSAGVQAQWKPSDWVTLNYSNFLQFNAFETQYDRRFFHNIYGIFTLARAWELTLGFDAGVTERLAPGARQEEPKWSTAVAILRWQCAGRWALAARAEYYNDPGGAIIQFYDGAAMAYAAIDLSGYSLNVDYQLAPNALARLEGRLLANSEPVFWQQRDTRTWLTASLGVSF